MKDKDTQVPIWNIANILTMIRIAIIPLFIVLLILVDPEKSHRGQWFDLQPAIPAGNNMALCWGAALLFLAASITDYFDGYYARKYNLVTNLGKLLDPLADKLLVIGAMIMLVELNRLPGWMALIIISREVAITALRGIASEKGVVIAASNLGKYKTATQITALVGLLLYYPFPIFIWYSGNAFAFGMVMITLAVFLTVYSGLDYFLKFWRYMVK